jgi:methionyl-tRNA formyltransferase
MQRIILITSDEVRHVFFRKFIASSNKYQTVKTYVETDKRNDISNDLINEHLLLREQTERDFFDLFNNRILDSSNPKYIQKGQINSIEIVDEIIYLNPDLIISYGCSIIKSSLLLKFKGKFVNIHLGLSPYYRGSGTNFFPFVNNEPEYVGATFMYIDEGIDTGEIIHQIRPTIYLYDNIHHVGNRLIKEMAIVCEKLIINFNKLKTIDSLSFNLQNQKYYRKKDFTDDTVKQMYLNFQNNMIIGYLNNKLERDNKVPIIENQVLL